MINDQDLFGASILTNYHRYLVPLIFDDYARDLATRLRVPAGARVLETACGTGALTRHLRAALPRDATLVSTDINPTMLEAARANLNGNGASEYREADGTELPFDAADFDALACQFGVMFYPDKKLGYREAARVLRPGGTFLFNVWDALPRNPLFELVHEEVGRRYPDAPPRFLALPFSYHDLDSIKSDLQRAGFTEVEISVLPRQSRAPSAREVALAIVAGTPLAGELATRGAERETLEAVESALIDVYGTGKIVAPMQAISIEARLGHNGNHAVEPLSRSATLRERQRVSR